MYKHCVLFLGLILSTSMALAEVAGKMAIIGDAGEKGKELSALKKSLEAEGVSSLVMPGDNLYSGSYASVWDDWKKSGFKFDAVAIGNHNDGYEEEVKYFGMPGEYYSTVKFGARFIILNSDNKRSVSEQMSWLDRELTNASESLIFIVYHHPTFTVTDTHDWEEKKDFQIKMRQMLKKYEDKISALLLGHDHISSFIEFGNTPVILSGSGREVRKADEVSYEEAGFKVETKYLAPRTPYWAKMEIMDGAKEARVEFVNVKTQKVSCSAVISSKGMTLGACD